MPWNLTLLFVGLKKSIQALLLFANSLSNFSAGFDISLNSPLLLIDPPRIDPNGFVLSHLQTASHNDVEAQSAEHLEDGGSRPAVNSRHMYLVSFVS